MKKCILPVLSSIFTVSTFGFLGSLQYAGTQSNGWMISAGFAIAAGVSIFFTIRLISKNMIQFSENQSSELKEVQSSLQTLDQNCKTAIASYEQQVQSAIEENRCANAHFIKESEGILDEVKAQLNSLNHEVSTKMNTMNTSYMQAVDEMQKSINALVAVSLEAFIKTSTETSQSMNNETNVLLETKIQMIVDLLRQQNTQLEIYEKNISTITEKTLDLQNTNIANALEQLLSLVNHQSDIVDSGHTKLVEIIGDINRTLDNGSISLTHTLEQLMDVKFDSLTELQNKHNQKTLEHEKNLENVVERIHTEMMESANTQNQNIGKALMELLMLINRQADTLTNSCAKQEEQTEKIGEAISDGEKSLKKSLERILDIKLDTMVEMQKLHEAQMLEMNGKIKDVTDTYNTTLHQINQNSHKLEELTKEDIVLLKRLMGAK